MPKKSVFSIPKWDDDLPDMSKQFKVKEVPFLVDKKQKEQKIQKRKILKAKRLLEKKSSNGEKMDTEFVPGQFVRAPQLEDDSPNDNSMFELSGQGRKRQLSDSEESDEEIMPQRSGSILKPSAFTDAFESAFGKMDEDDDGWQTISKKQKKKKLKSSEMEIDEVKSNPPFSKNGSTLATQEPNSFRNKLIDSLKGSRFRFINEQLYKCEGTEAKKLFDQDPAAFAAYHDGYRQQVQQWPANPLDRIIKNIQKLPINNIIADFGCGEARLSQEVPQEVHSLDLVAARPEVIACDMAHTPLKSESVDVAVFCLSLMGTNLKDFLLEANRILKPRGLLKIAEVASRFDNDKYFISNVERCGFTLVTKDLSDKLFYFFTFKKGKSAKDVANSAKNFSLKPCLYKKR